MEIKETALKGVFLITQDKKIDERGYFERVWDIDEFKSLESSFVQVSISSSLRKGTLRGLHFQIKPYEEVRFVTCLKGKLFDVVVDLRKDSSTFAKWQSFELSEMGLRSVYIPKGVAHGHLSLEDNTLVLYCISAKYQPEFSAGIRWNDPTLAINWPISKPIISNKDSKLPWFKELIFEK